MALSDMNGSTGTTMLVQPAYCSTGYSNNGGGSLFGNGNDWLGILFLIALCNNGWGGFGFGGGGAAGASVTDGYILASDFSQISKQISDTYNMTDRKFDAISNGLCSLGYDQLAQMNGINQNISTTGYGITNAITTGGYETRNAISGIGSQLAQCCCDVREGIANVNYNAVMNTNSLAQAIGNGFCTSNYNNSNNTRDIIDSQHSDADRIIARIDAMENSRQAEKIAELQSENQSLRFAASQERQNAYLLSELGQKCPQPAYVVQPPQSITFPTNCCGGVSYASGGCGCNG